MKNYDLITPEGTRDLVFDECERLRVTQQKLRTVFENAGFREIITPGLEFFDVFSSKSRGFPGEELYKTSDEKGRVLVLRPDSTLPIARIAATRLKNAPRPLKLYYCQNVFRNNPGKRRRNDEIRQMGVEVIGEENALTDNRIALLALDVLSLAATAGKRVMLEIGDIGIVSGLLKKLETDDDTKEKIRGLIRQKKLPELSDVLNSIGTSTANDLLLLSAPFEDMIDLRLNIQELNNQNVQDKLEALIDLGQSLKQKSGIDVMIEPEFVGEITYYSGIVIRGYVEECGEPVLSGGRYDNLMREFGGNDSAIGFMVNVDLFCNALEASEKDSMTKPIRIALTKGRLEKSVVKLLEGNGFDVSELKDKGRKLIFKATSPDGVLYEFILAKSPDVITYVESGVCDLGVVGYDMIAEHGGKFYEIDDLGIGVCRFALAGIAGKKDAFFADYRNKTIATKYPSVARGYFEDRGLDIDIVKIEGSVELAPILGLSDAIVDIVETGATLRENGLEVYEDIVPISARVIGNRTAYRMRRYELSKFEHSLRGKNEY
jgi:ATP phosphoribosyltransferase regulatory subunit